MWLQAILTADDLKAALTRITPARIQLDKDDPERCLWVSRPETVVLRNDKDLYVTCHAQIRWDVIGIPVPIKLRHVALSLTPQVEKIDGKESLSFAVRVEEADLSAVPEFLENTLIARVNEALSRPDAKLSWHFLETLDFEFGLPVVQPARRLSLFARWGALRISDEGLALVVGWGIDAEVVGEEVTPPAFVQQSVADAETMPAVGEHA